jgi:hypothetical protein
MLFLLVTASFLGQHHLRQRRNAFDSIVAMLLIGIIGQGFLPCGCCLLLLFFCHYRTHASFLLVLQAGERGLTLLLPCTCSGMVDLGVMVAKPKEDGCCGCRPSCLGSAFFKKALATSGFLMFMCGTPIKKLLATNSLLSLTSSFLVKKALAGCCLVALALVLPQFVHNPRLVLASLFCLGTTPGKNRSPQWQWWQKPRVLVVFAPGSTQPIVIEMGASVPLRGGGWHHLNFSQAEGLMGLSVDKDK